MAQGIAAGTTSELQGAALALMPACEVELLNPLRVSVTRSLVLETSSMPLAWTEGFVAIPASELQGAVLALMPNPFGMGIGEKS